MPPKPDENEGPVAAKKLFDKCLDSLKAFENDLLTRLIFTHEIQRWINLPKLRQAVVDSIEVEIQSPAGPNDSPPTLEYLRVILPELYCPVIRADFTGADNGKITE